ncbi:unnamed protein product, partial [Choristocarpus tenellus]
MHTLVQCFHGQTASCFAGGETVQMYAKGPDGILIHGTVNESDSGKYMVSFWPAFAGAYTMTVIINGGTLGASQWAL